MEDKKIVVAYDGSSYSAKALDMAASLAKTMSASVVLVSVADMTRRMNSDVGNIEMVEAVFRREGAHALELGKKHAAELGVPVADVLLEGSPADEILKYAQAENACMIVVGSRGRGGFQRLMLGSTAQSLVTYSTIPVLVVK